MDAAVYSYLTGSYSSYNVEMFRLRQHVYKLAPRSSGLFLNFTTLLFRPLVWPNDVPLVNASYLFILVHFFSKTLPRFLFNFLLAWVAKPIWYFSCIVVRWCFLLFFAVHSFLFFYKSTNFLIEHYSWEYAIFGERLKCLPFWFFGFLLLWVYSRRFRHLISSEFEYMVLLSWHLFVLFYSYYNLDLSSPHYLRPDVYPRRQKKVYHRPVNPDTLEPFDEITPVLTLNMNLSLFFEVFSPIQRGPDGTRCSRPTKLHLF
jgi:hypothetical protein